MRIIFALLCLLLAAPALAQESVFQDAGKRVALVIGVSDYTHVAPLRNPGKDAALMADALQKLRFEVVHVADPKHADFAAQSAAFIDKLEGADIAVLYYAGHAIQVDGMNHLVPADAQLSTLDSIDTQLVSLASIVNAMDQKAKTKVIVLDACRNNPFEETLAQAIQQSGAKRQLGTGLAAVSEAAPASKPEAEGFNTYGSIIAFSAAPGTVATDGEGDNSPYTAALASELVKPGVELGQVFRVAAANVVRETQGEQKPEFLVRLTDEVYFSRPEPSDCDYFAIAPFNQVGIAGVEFDKISPARAIPACEQALLTQPGHPRFTHNLGRAHDAAGNYDKAVEYYRVSAEQGYSPAISTLGVMHINGQGTKQDFEEGVRLLKQASALGYRLAKVALRNQDFTQIFTRKEYQALQQALKDRGFYKGTTDGDFGAASKKALEAYQTAEGLTQAGGTLETLDRLGLVKIIPNYEL